MIRALTSAGSRRRGLMVKTKIIGADDSGSLRSRLGNAVVRKFSAGGFGLPDSTQPGG